MPCTSRKRIHRSILICGFEQNKSRLKPPIGNIQLWKGDWQNLLVMMVGGPNYRPDYHDDPGEELFIQLRGDVVLKLIDPVTRERVKLS